jgi:hypothetical protein
MNKKPTESPEIVLVEDRRSPLHGIVNQCFDAMLEVNCHLSAAEKSLRGSHHVAAAKQLDQALKKLGILVPRLQIAAYEAGNLSKGRRKPALGIGLKGPKRGQPRLLGR